jgi:hypothetical protein
MFCLYAVVCSCVSPTDVFLWGSSWSCIDVQGDSGGVTATYGAHF